MRFGAVVVALLSAGLVVPSLAQTRGFEWFFTNVKKPDVPCSGEMIVASWYDTGSYTASGKAFDPNGHTAAHRTLPFGTQILITNPHTSKSLLVTINDRGPFTKGVILDLARGAARGIGMTQTQWVCMETITEKAATK